MSVVVINTVLIGSTYNIQKLAAAAAIRTGCLPTGRLSIAGFTLRFQCSDLNIRSEESLEAGRRDAHTKISNLYHTGLRYINRWKIQRHIKAPNARWNKYCFVCWKCSQFETYMDLLSSLFLPIWSNRKGIQGHKVGTRRKRNIWSRRSKRLWSVGFSTFHLLSLFFNSAPLKLHYIIIPNEIGPWSAILILNWHMCINDLYRLN